MLLQQAAAIRDTVRTDSVVVESPLPGGLAAIARFLFSTVPQWVQITGAILGVIVGVVVLLVLWKHRKSNIAGLGTRTRGW